MREIPKVSIIIPAFNCEKYISSAISSALNQTYPNIEVVVVDDHSSDETVSVINEIKSNKIVFIKLEKNFGASNAKNVGFKSSSGDYIAFLDSDDLYSTNKIEEQMNIFKNSNKQNLGYVYCGIEIINEEGKHLMNSTPTGKAWDGIINEDFIGASALIKRKCFEEAGMFDLKLKYFEDMDLYLRIKLCGYEYDFSKKALYIYRQHRMNVSKNRKLVIDNIDRYFEKYLSLPKFKKNKKILSQYYMNKGVVLSTISPLEALHFVFLSFILNPFVVIRRIHKLLKGYLTLITKKLN